MTDLAKWWTDWQSADHAAKFDFRSYFPWPVLARDLESFNEVRMLNEILREGDQKTLLEVGCATGDFYRYVHRRYPRIVYDGIDISRPAVDRARTKSPAANVVAVPPDWNATSVFELCGGRKPQIVFCRDVVHHAVDPFEFLSRLLELPTEALVIRTRTRDNGPTELDPEKSCQHHYNGWMPYIVMNLSEMLDHLRQRAPKAGIVVYRNHMVLGGKHNRYLPKDCYLPETGTSETSVSISLMGSNPDGVTIKDRVDGNPRYSPVEMMLIAFSRVWKAMS